MCNITLNYTTISTFLSTKGFCGSLRFPKKDSTRRKESSLRQKLPHHLIKSLRRFAGNEMIPWQKAQLGIGQIAV